MFHAPLWQSKIAFNQHLSLPLLLAGKIVVALFNLAAAKHSGNGHGSRRRYLCV